MLAEIHVLPDPLGTAEQTYAHVDAAIAVIADSGLTYEVGALGTTIEGPADRLWAVLREVHDATLAAGAGRTMTTIRIIESADRQPSMSELVGPHRG
jgi:uncharacterized protein (TIGR00106 family)